MANFSEDLRQSVFVRPYCSLFLSDLAWNSEHCDHAEHLNIMLRKKTQPVLNLCK